MGNGGGSYALYTLAYPGDGSPVEVSFEVLTADPAVVRATGVNVYGPTAGKLYARTAPEGGPIRKVSFASAEPGSYLVQVYNYAPVVVAFRLVASRSLTGQGPGNRSIANPARRPIAVVVENEPAARPQSGLGDADAIYEAVAEFNLTRFVAVFVDATADAVGPIRSARPYHAAIAGEYGAGLAHCLDVPPVPATIQAARAVNLEACRGAGVAGFRRDPMRAMPHNLYASVPALQAVAGAGGSYGPLATRGSWPDGGVAVSSLSFVYPAGHTVAWRYDPARNEYLRWQDGAAHVDARGRQIAASTVVVQFVPVRDVRFYGEAGYHEVDLTGRGEAVVYSGGTRLRVSWQRSSLAEPTRFLREGAGEVAFPPGRVFFQIVAAGTPLEERR